MSEILPTLKIIQEGNVVTINESDYDPKVHKLAENSGEQKEETEEGLESKSFAELKEIAEEKGVDVKGIRSKDAILKALADHEKPQLFAFPNAEGKFIVVDASGDQVGEDVYDTQEEAEKAIG